MATLPNILYRDPRLGGAERWFVGPPGVTLMRVADEILQCVLFLCVRYGNGTVRYGGTAFYLGRPSERHPSALTHGYIVTAKHNIERAREEPGRLHLRANRVDGGVEFIDVSGGQWAYHESSGSDAAVLPLPLDPGIFAFQALPVRMCATPEVIDRIHIGIGDELLVVGLFTKRHGERQNRPIVAQVSSLRCQMSHWPIGTPEKSTEPTSLKSGR